jgi:hypothetical protein
MHVEYEVTKRDYVSAAMLAAHKGPLSIRLRYYYVYAFAILWLVVTVATSRTDGHWNIVDMLFGFGFVAVMALFVWAKFAREYQRSANLHGIQQLDANESGVRFVTTESDTRSTWKAYSKFAENSKVFILFHPGNKTFIPIPKSALNSEQATELRSLFKASFAR